MPDIIITPNRAFTATGIPSIEFSGVSGASNIQLQVLQDGSLAFIGSAGGLFGIQNSLTGSLMSVNDIAGLPILEVFDNDKVVMGSYGTNAFVVSGSGSAFGTDKVPLNRSVYISGSLEYLGGVYSRSQNITGNYTVAETDNRLYLNNADPITVTFDDAIANSGQIVHVKKINTGLALLTGEAGQLFDGSPLYVMGSIYESISLHSNGSHWYVW